MKCILLFLTLCLPILVTTGQTLIEPRRGIEIPEKIQSELSAEVQKLQQQADTLRQKLMRIRQKLAKTPKLLRFLPDAEIFHESVRRTLEDEIFYSNKQFDVARKLLKMGKERLDHLEQGKTPWNEQTGLVVRGYVSEIDGSLQPYGLVVPENYQPGIELLRLDIWQHGRSNKLSEVAFIDQRLSKPGIFTPDNTIVLHPYGRYCNAMKFAGEVDTFEAMDAVKSFYLIDEDRICMRGFSMGGAAAWHFGAHYADQWAAVNPGAGFVDVKIYQGLTGKLDTIPWYEKKMWNLYDPLAVAVNLTNTTLVAYSGEEDKQKQAADLMEAALAKEGHRMAHIVGPKTGHKYEPKAKEKVGELVDTASAYTGYLSGRNLRNKLILKDAKISPPAPPFFFAVHYNPYKVRFETHSLKYNKMHWLVIDALENHWEKARLEGELKEFKYNDDSGSSEATFHIKTENVSAFSINIGHYAGSGIVYIDNQNMLEQREYTGVFRASFHKDDGKWKWGKLPDDVLRKKHDLQGPIDDAFMAPFLVVTPSEKSFSPKFDKWVDQELKEFLFQWRKQFRGEARVKKDRDLTLEDIENYNLILFGDPKSNSYLSDIIYSLPYRWKKTHFEVNGKEYSFDTHAPAMIYPNPRNRERYIVINSGFTFAAAGKASNSRQTPRLPDWAVLDLNVAPLDRADGTGVVDAGFFDEQWKWKSPIKPQRGETR